MACRIKLRTLCPLIFVLGHFLVVRSQVPSAWSSRFKPPPPTTPLTPLATPPPTPAIHSPNRTNDLASAYALMNALKDQVNDETKRSIIKELMSTPSYGYPSSELALSSDDESVVSAPPPINFSQSESVRREFHGRGSSNKTTWHMPKSGAINDHGPSPASAPLTDSPYNGYIPHLSTYTRQPANKDYLKLSSSNDHVQDILSRFRNNHTTVAPSRSSTTLSPSAISMTDAPDLETTTVSPQSSSDSSLDNNEEEKFDMLDDMKNDRYDSSSEGPMDMENSMKKEKINNPPMMRFRDQGGQMHSGRPQQQSPQPHSVKFSPSEMKQLDQQRSKNQQTQDYRQVPPVTAPSTRSKNHVNKNEERQTTSSSNSNRDKERDTERGSEREREEVVKSEDKQPPPKIEKVIHVVDYKYSPEVMFNDPTFMGGPPLLQQLRPRNPFQLTPQYLPFPPPKMKLGPGLGLGYPSYPLQYPRYYTVDDHMMQKLTSTLEPNADTNKPEHVEPDGTPSEDGTPGKEGTFGYTTKVGPRGELINEIEAQGFHPGLMGGHPLASGGGPAIHPGGSMVTCCKTFYQPAGGPPVPYGAGAGEGPGGEERGAVAAASNNGGGAEGRGPGIIGPGAEPGTVCFQEPVGYPHHPQPHPLLLAKQLKLQKLLYPFFFKKRLFFG